MTKISSLLALACGWVLLAPASALAAAAPPVSDHGESTPLDLPADAPRQLETASGGGGSLARTFIGLAVVVAVIYGVAWALRKMKSTQEDRTTGFGLSAEATVALGPGRSVHLIRAGRELVLVGSAEKGVVPIRTYTEDEAYALGLLRDGDDDAGPGPRPGRGASLVAGVVEQLRRRTAR